MGEIYGVILGLFGLVLYYVGPFIVLLIAIFSLFSALSGKRKDKFIISGGGFIIAGFCSLYLSTLNFNWGIESYQTNLFFSIYFAIMPFICLIVGIPFIIIGILRGYEYYKADIEMSSQSEENYKNEKWLKMHYYNRGRSIQEIANHENVSMMEIEKTIRKIELSKDDKK